MALTITNNVASLTAQFNLNRTSISLSQSLERLSSGLKINRGADGPAALVISEEQRAQITGLRTTLDNTNKAISLVQTGEGALNEINSLLLQIRGLALDSANSGVNDTSALAANQSQITNALRTIDTIVTTTQFGTKKLLDGSAGMTGKSSDQDVTFLKATTETQPGTYDINITTPAEKGSVAADQAQKDALKNAETLTINGVGIILQAGLSQAGVVDLINKFKDQTGVIAEIDSITSATRLVTTRDGAAASVKVQSDAAASQTSSGFGTVELTGTGVDVARTAGQGNVLTATKGAAKGLSITIGNSEDALHTVSGEQGTVEVNNKVLLFQIGPNAGQTASLNISKVTTDRLGVSVAGTQFRNLGEIVVTTASDAQDSIKVINQAISDITNLSAQLGAFQTNTLQANASNLQAALVNTVSVESTIRDTDFAAEVASFTKQQMLLQADSATLSNANQLPQLVSLLLRG